MDFHHAAFIVELNAAALDFLEDLSIRSLVGWIDAALLLLNATQPLV